MYIKDLHLPWESSLIKDFYQHFDTSSVSVHFAYNPWIGESFRHRYRFLQEKRDEPFPRKKLINVIRKQYGQQRLHPQIERNLQRFEDQRSCVVIGGQQAGLLTGPLYTIYKAITIIQLAQREERRLGVPVIPVFWIAGEDHDFEEVNHIWIRNFTGRMQKLTFDHPFSTTINRMPVSSLPLDQEKMQNWLEDVSDQLPDSPYKREWIQLCKDVTYSATTWGQHFLQMMQRLFAQWGLICIDSDHQELRQLEGSFFSKLVKQNRSLQRVILTAQQECVQHQFHVPVKVEKNHAHLFIKVDGERYPLFHLQDKWLTRDGVHRWTTDELLELAAEKPEQLSNNVLTRPLMQEYLFPTLAFVGGPTEISYWALLRRAFVEMGLQMPIVYPRAQITLVDQTAVKRASHFNLTIEDLFFAFEEKKNQWLNQQVTVDVDQLFQQTKAEIDQLHQKLVHQLEEQLELKLREMGAKNRTKINEQIDYLHRYVRRAIAEKYQTELRRMNELVVRVLPLKKPQERVYNLIQIWNEHGLTWLSRLVHESQLLMQVPHQLVYI